MWNPTGFGQLLGLEAQKLWNRSIAGVCSCLCSDVALFDIDKVNILPQMSRYDYGGQDLFLDQPKDANKDSVSTCWCMLGRIIGVHVSSGRGCLTMNGLSMVSKVREEREREGFKLHLV